MDTGMVAALEDLRAQLTNLRLPLLARDSEHACAVAGRAADQIDDYLIPRLRSLDAPLLVVVSGSTGSGKSTVVNSLVGRVVSTPGVLRPTTRHPVLVHNPEDRRWFVDDRVLPRLPRITGATGALAVPTDAGTAAGPAPSAAIAAAASAPAGTADVRALQLVADPSVPTGLALLDAPDIDSVSAANRELAAMLMAAADLWLFLTTAARYADAVPWDALQAARARDAALALVLNRVPDGAEAQVAEHLTRLLTDEGLAQTPLFVITEAPLVEGMIPGAAIEPVRGWLAALAGDAPARAAVARRTLEGALNQLSVDLLDVADAVDRQVLAANRLRDLAAAPFRRAIAGVNEVAADGSLLRGEVLGRWQEFVGASELFRSIESGMGRLRDRIARAFRSEPEQPEQVADALESGLVKVLLDALSGACEQADASWRDDPAGRSLLGEQDFARVPGGARAQAEALVRAWQDDVLQMVRTEGADRRSSARVLAYSVNGGALALMVLVFSTTGGLTGAEVGIAGGSAVLAQKLLEAVFSEDEVRRMSETARERLEERVAAFFARYEATFTEQIDRLGVDPDGGAALRHAVATVVGLRSTTEPVDLPVLPQAPPLPVPQQPRRRFRDWLRGTR